MKITRKSLRSLIEQADEKESEVNADARKKIDSKVADYLASEGGAASEEGTEEEAEKASDGVVKGKEYLANHERFAQLTVAGDPQDYYDKELAEVRTLIRETLKKIGFYKKYSYGLDDVPEKTKAHDDIIGHT